MKTILKCLLVICALAVIQTGRAADLGPRPESRVITYADGTSYANALDIGEISENAYCTDIRDTWTMWSNGNHPRIAFYKFTLLKPMYVAVTHEGSELVGTEMSVTHIGQSPDYDIIETIAIPNQPIEMAREVFGDWMTPASVSGNQLCSFGRLEPGTYYIQCSGAFMNGSQGNNNGLIRTNFYAVSIPGVSYESAVDLGTYDDEFECMDLYPLSSMPGPSAPGLVETQRYYKVTLTKTMEVHYGGNFMHIDFQDDDKRSFGPYPPKNPITLNPGSYFIVTVSSTSPTGMLEFRMASMPVLLQGDAMSNAVTFSTAVNGFDFKNRISLENYTDQYDAHPSKDVFYGFRIDVPMNVTVLQENAVYGDSFVALLDRDGNLLKSSIAGQVYVRQLQAGTYYAVFEEVTGKLTEIKARIKGTAESAEGGLQLSGEMNYILSVSPSVATDNADELEADQARIAVKYYDGLGRLAQFNEYKASPEMADIVSVMEYDRCGRDSVQWLPVPCRLLGAYIPETDFKSQAEAMYGDIWACSETVYENSPLNRPVKESGPGSNWRTNDRNVKKRYLVDNGFDLRNNSRVAPERRPLEINDLNLARYRICETTDEDGNKHQTYSDRQGRTVLERSYNGAENHDVRYWYDNFGDLCMVHVNHDPVSQTSSSEPYMYEYEYSSTGRQVAKKIPGAGWTYYCYNQAGMLIASQDARQRVADKWLVSIPDRFGRTVLTGFISSPEFGRGMEIPLFAEFDPAQQATYGYKLVTENSFAIADVELLSVNYYDNYSFLGLNEQGMLTYQQDTAYGAMYGDIQHMVQHKGLRTGAVRIERNSGREIWTAMYYDYRKRPVQTRSTTVDGGIYMAKNRYDFFGQALASCEIVQPASNSRPDTLCVENTYDAVGRLLACRTTLNGGTTAFVSNAYDEIGRLIGVTQGEGPGSLSTSRSYNIRGWLTEQLNPKFDMWLAYETPVSPTTVPSYAGNITEWKWRHGRDEVGNTYAFSYDGLSRLTGSRQFIDGIANDQFVEKGLTYDKIGNMLTLDRMEEGSIKNKYRYTYTGNQLTMLEDDLHSYAYRYDENGNMLHDGLHDLDLTYNPMNLLEKVKRGNSVLANYSYLSDGTRLSALDDAGNGLEYIGSLVYRRLGDNLTLESAGFSGGRFVSSTGGFESLYFLTDHLGSTRVVVNGAGEVLERNDYYPFGLRWESSQQLVSDNRYRYNGKEEQSFLGLPYADYGARMFDSELAVWPSVDPLAEKYYGVGPYVFCAGNPIKFIDRDGREVDDYFNLNGTYLGTDDASTDNVRIISNDVWSVHAEDGIIDHETGNANSVAFSAAPMTDENALKVFERYNDTGIASTVDNESRGDFATLTKVSTTTDNNKVTKVEVKNISIGVKVAVNKASGFYDNANNIMSSYQHEQGHINDIKNDPVAHYNRSPSEREQRAISYQKKNPIYQKTTPAYQKRVDLYEAQFKNKPN